MIRTMSVFFAIFFKMSGLIMPICVTIRMIFINYNMVVPMVMMTVAILIIGLVIIVMIAAIVTANMLMQRVIFAPYLPADITIISNTYFDKHISSLEYQIKK